MEEDKASPTDQYYNPTPAYTEKRTKPRLLLFLVTLIVLAVIGFLLFKYVGSKTKKQEPAVTPIPTEAPTPSDTPTAATSPSPTPKTSSTPSPKPTSNPIDKTTGLDRSKLAVEVQNGSGVTGVAAKAADTLKSLGYNVASIGNADNSNYDKTVIQVKAGKSDYLALLKKDLSSNYTIGSATSDLSASSSADALVIVGKQ